MAGYDASLFVDGPMMRRRHLVCALCRLVMRDSVTLIDTCQHSFCDTCLNDFLSNGLLVCPVDRKALDYAQIFADEMKRLEILSSKVFCRHYKNGCRWTDRLQNLQDHLEVCRFELIVCPNNCSARLSKVALNDHVMYTCAQRKVTCSTCRQELTAEAMELHEGCCPMEPVWCEYKCGARVPRRHIEQHMHNDCIKRTTVCTHCHKQFLYETLNDHFLQCPRFPVVCPNRCDSSLRICREDLATHVTTQCSSSVASCPFKDVGCKHTGNRSTLDQHSQDTMCHHLSLLSSVVVTQQRIIDDLSCQLSQTTCVTNGTFVWKVTNFKSKLTKAKSSSTEDVELRSTPFYTSRHGYRLSILLFPGGNGSGEGTHLSIYIRVLPGEYDNILEWPFRLPIVFKLFDQCSDPEKRQNVIESFTPNPSWKQFQKPVKEAGDNSGFGYPKFVTLELLQSGTYVRDDCIFVRIKVDVSKFIEP